MIETVFNHGITEEERGSMGMLDKDKYLSIVGEETARRDIARLLHRRGEKREVVEKYLDGLPPMTVIDFWRTVTHP